MPFNSENALDRLYDFKLQDLFVQELGWSNPTKQSPEAVEVEGQVYWRSQIAQMSGVQVLEITSPDGDIPTVEIHILKKPSLKEFRHMRLFSF